MKHTLAIITVTNQQMIDLQNAYSVAELDADTYLDFQVYGMAKNTKGDYTLACETTKQPEFYDVHVRLRNDEICLDDFIIESDNLTHLQADLLAGEIGSLISQSAEWI